MTIKISELLSDVQECALPLEEPSSSSWGKIQKLTLDKINGEQAAPAPKKRNRRRVALLAVAALLSVCVTVTAAASGALSAVGDLFAAWFGGEPDQIELIEQLGQPLGVSDSRNGITMSADAILSDGNNFVVLFTVSRDNGEPLIPADAQPGGHLYFGYTGGNQGTPERPVGFNSRAINTFMDGAPGDSTAHYLSYYEAPNGLPGTLQCGFNSLEYWYDDNTRVLKLEEEVGDPGANEIGLQLEIPLPSGGQVVKTVPTGGQTFSANGEEFAVTGLKVSPLAVTVEYEVVSTTPSKHATVIAREKSEDGKTELGEYHDDTSAFVENMVLTLRKKDGTEMDLSTFNDGFKAQPAGTDFTDWEQDKYFCRYGGVLPEVVPMEDMDCVIFNGLEYPIDR